MTNCLVGKETVGDVVRVKSVVFAVTFPPDNIYGPNACNPGVSLAAGSYSPSVADGYYTLLPPLSLGTHTLHIHGEVPPPASGGTTSFVLDVTYHLTIVLVVLK